jgi:hypothetical protein
MKACKFCHFLNSYVCDDDDHECIGCGRCGKVAESSTEKGDTQ